MMMRTTRSHILSRFEECAIPYTVLLLQNDVSIVVSQHGGRILGPFLTPESESLFWINPAFHSAQAFRAFLDAEEWNLGGERVWVAPEIQYSVRDRTDFWDSIMLPPQMDPGKWTLAKDEAWGSRSAWTLSQTLTLEAYNLAQGRKTLHIGRLIRPAADPLRNLRIYAKLLDGVTFAGYSHTIELSGTKIDSIMSESWNLVQLNPGGELLIPTTFSIEYSDYFEPIDADYQALDARSVRLRITGDRRYKVGYKAAQLFGRLGYVNHLDDGRAYLIVRNFFNNPSAPYIEEPADCIGCRGHSVHVYNDGGMFGGFGELECNGQTIGGETGRASSTDTFVLWLYVGSREKIEVIAQQLLGVTLSKSVL